MGNKEIALIETPSESVVNYNGQSPEMRPELQRTELGPILNHLTLMTIEAAEARWQKDIDDDLPAMSVNRQSLRQQPVFYDLGYLSSDLDKNLQAAAGNQIISLPSDAKYAISQLLHTKFKTGGPASKLTFFGALGTLFSEGLSSGLTMPFNAYAGYWAQTLTNTLNNAEISGQPLNISDFISTMRSRRFHATLLMAAHTRNGFYEELSTKFNFSQHSNPFKLLGCPFNQDFSLTPEARARLRVEFDRATVMMSYLYGRTDGCPVRRSSYPNLGPTAQRYAEALGIDPNEVQYPAKSAIIRSCEYIANCTDRLLSRPVREDQIVSDAV